MASLAVVSLLVTASAATLGGIDGGRLTTTSIASQRCDDQVTFEPVSSPGNPNPGTYDQVHLSDVAGACAGSTAQVTAPATDGSALAAGSTSALSPTFTVSLSPAVSMAAWTGIALAIDGWGIATVAGGSPFTTSLHLQSDWGLGYCAEVTVSTTSPTPLAWAVTVSLATYPFNGTPHQYSNATATWSPPDIHASGVGWNDLVSSGHPQIWEYCATRSTPPPTPVTTSFRVDSDWGLGYCVTVTESTTSPTPIVWSVDVSLATAPLNGVPYTVWNAVWSWSPPTLHAVGVDWNGTIVAGQPQEWGFCANR